MATRGERLVRSWYIDTVKKRPMPGPGRLCYKCGGENLLKIATTMQLLITTGTTVWVCAGGHEEVPILNLKGLECVSL